MKRCTWMLVAGLSGCGPLIANPGEDFRVAVRNATPISLIQQVAPVELAFEVSGCDTFSATVETTGAAHRRQYSLETTRRDNGVFSAAVPVEFLHGDTDECRNDGESPETGQAQLVVKCELDGREARSEAFSVTYATAWRAASRARGPVEAVFPGEAPDTFFTVGNGYLDFNDASGSRGDTLAAIQPGYTPLLAQTEEYVYLWSGCPLGNCGNVLIVDTPEEKIGTSATHLQVFPFDATRGRMDRPGHTLQVPATGIDLVVEPGGEVVLLSSHENGTVLSRIRGHEVTDTLLLEGESAPTRFGRLGSHRVFLTRPGANPERIRLRRIDGKLIGEFALAGSGTLGQVSLAPSGNQWVYARGGQVWLTGIDELTLVERDAIQLTTGMGEGHFDAAWLSSHVALWNEEHVETFTRIAPHGPTATMIPLSNRGSPAHVRHVRGMGESIAVLTLNGLQLFDPQGKLLGGADPLPAQCGSNLLPPQMAIVDESTAVLGGNGIVFRFRVGSN